jgi:hypothetical protein
VCRIAGQILHEKKGLELDQLDLNGSLIAGPYVASRSLDIDIQADPLDDPAVEEVSHDFVGHSMASSAIGSFS